MMNDLSMLQKRVLSFVKAFLNNYGYPPSVREIATGCDIKSTSTVHNAMNALEQKGYITRDGGQSRSTVLTGFNHESGVYSVPIKSFGKNGEEFGIIDMPKSLVQDREGVFAIKCSEDYAPQSIKKGDVLIVKSCNEVSDGDVVAYDDGSIGVFSQDEKFSSDEEINSEVLDLELLDGVADNDKKNALIIGKIIVCIRCF